MNKINHALKLLVIIISVFFIGYLLESYRSVSPVVGDYFEVSTELLPLVVSFSIFFMTWLAYKQNKDNHSLFMGFVFFLIGILDLYHMVSYPFMPDFITPNSPNKAAIFWGEARLLCALLFFASVYVYKDTFPELIKIPVLFVFTALLSFISLITTSFYPDYLPVLYYHDGSPSTSLIFLIIITAVIMSYTCYLYAKRLGESGQKNITCIIYGLIILALSNLVYFHYDYSEHLLKAAGFYFLYLALFKTSIEQPYEAQVAIKKKLLYEAEERYKNIFDTAFDAIITVDLEDRVISWNNGAEKIFGWMAKETVGKKLSNLIVPPDLRIERELLLKDVISGRTVSGVDAVRLRKDGTKIDVSVSISPLRDANQNVIGLSSITRDITHRKRADDQIKESLKEKEILLREIHHRVKNNMQIISSLLRLQSGYIKEEKYLEMFKDSQNRIISMSLIHEKLYQSKDFAKIDFDEYIKDMVTGLYQFYGTNTDKIALNINAKDVSLGVDTAIPCGLIINELVTNSLKHAFPDDRKGKITISLCKTKEEEFELAVGDNGIGIPKDIDFRNTQSLGLYLVTLLAENQLQGEINLERSNGSEFKIKFKGEK